jgi:hypothetical protein
MCLVMARRAAVTALEAALDRPEAEFELQAR